jgi:arylsulfatase A-like enzyme
VSKAASWLVDAGLVLAAWAALLAAELVVVVALNRTTFAGGWEIRAAALSVAPIALAALVPFALVAPGLAREVEAAEHDVAKRRLLALVAAGSGALVAYGVSFGRHLASWAVRGPFLAVFAAAGAAGGWWLLPRLVREARARATRVAQGGAVAAFVAWCLDAWALPRLYPAFHEALLAIALAGGALVALLARGWSHRVRTFAGGAACVVAIASVAWALPAARGLEHADNVRLLLLERAPWLGRAVKVAAAIAPPAPLEGVSEASTRAAETQRVLDWSGRDIVLVSIDALRADHVSSYGYARPTTPAMDELARQGVRFKTAYCATPHTSYSVTSMMTGKYMHPLLTLGLGADSETWAAHLRRYGYRTAAFYPPAVFFIDEDRFATFRDRGLDFEYRKVQFSDPMARARELAAYLETMPAGTPLFAWVHFFEPHEPYVMHEAHRFGPPDAPSSVDAYDSEIAAADEGLGEIVRIVRARGRRPVFIVTADHGEEFGEHGGRYHGTTVYEEQVHVPLVVQAEGLTPAVVDAPVQTIDLLPTVLSALGVPRPPRVRGRDLGPLLAGKGSAEPGFAYAETDLYTRVVRGNDRLVCARAAGACRLFDGASDPNETRDRAADDPRTVGELKRLVASVEREHGRYEAGAGADLPEALRRGLQGDVEAAVDVAALLDDAKVEIRRAAAEVAFNLRAPATRPHLERAMSRDEDVVVRRWCALALARLGQAPPLVKELTFDPDIAWRRRSALVRAEQGDASGPVETELVGWWVAESPWRDQARARELLAALAKIHARSAPIAPALADVRLRQAVVEAMAEIPSGANRSALLATFANERYLHLREPEAKALLAMGVTDELRAPLARFAGVPEPMPGVLAIAARADLLVPKNGGLAAKEPAGTLHARLTVPKDARGLRLLVRVEGDHQITGAVAGRPTRIPSAGWATDERWVDLPPEPSGEVSLWLGAEVDKPGGLLALWIVPLADEIPPPPPAPWDAGAGEGARASEGDGGL